MSTVIVNLTDDIFSGFTYQKSTKVLPSATVFDPRPCNIKHWRGDLNTFLNDYYTPETKFIIYLGVTELDEYQNFDLLVELLNRIKPKNNIHICFINSQDIYDHKHSMRVNNFVGACHDIPGHRLEFVFNNTDLVNKFKQAFPESAVTFYSFFVSRFFRNINNIDIASTFRNKHFLCLNNRRSAHRDTVWHALKFHNVHLSYRARNILLNENNPWHQIQQKFLEDNPDLLTGNTGSGLAPDPNQYWSEYQDLLAPEYYNDACVYICTETLFDGIMVSRTDDEPTIVTHWWTEKLLKSFYYKLPTIVVGLPYVLESIKSLGFKTFDCFWDESYDYILDAHARMQHILQLIDHIGSMSINELNDMYYSRKMQDILCHNQQLMVDLNDKYNNDYYY
jgi:hypothetical protein